MKGITISRVWIVLSLVPVTGAFSFYYILTREFYSNVRKLRGYLIENLNIINRINEYTNVTFLHNFINESEKLINQLRGIQPRTALKYSLIMTLLDVVRIIFLNDFCKDVEAYLNRRTRCRYIPSLLLILFLISGALRGILDEAGYWFYIMPSMSLVHITWLSAIPFKFIPLKISMLCPLTIYAIVILEGAVILILHYELLRNVNEVLVESVRVLNKVRANNEVLRSVVKEIESWNTPVPPPIGEKECPHCKKKVPRIAIYCPYCGYVIFRKTTK
mgnify:CR=1 FL=1